MTKHFSLTTEQMACVYAWLAQLFSRERDDESLAILQSSEMAEWFAVLKGEPLLEAQVLFARGENCRAQGTGRRYPGTGG